MLSQVRARSAVDYMLRTAQQNQMALATLADQKANIVLGLTLLFVSLSATQSGAGETALSLLGMLVAGTVAALFALAALIPGSSTVHRQPKAGADPAPVNPIFFGGIGTLPRSTYFDQMEEIIGSDERVYTAIIADLHEGACVLRRKYQLLRYSYISLFTGLVISSALWVLRYVNLL